MVIASVDAPAVIGYDFIFENQCQIDVRKGCIELQGQIVTCQRESQLPKIFTVSLASTVTIPSSSEAIVMGTIKGDASHYQQMVIEPVGIGLSKKGLVMGKSVAYTDSGQVPIRILNTGPTDIKLYKGMNIASCEAALRVIPIEQSESEESASVRNISKAPEDVPIP